MRVSNLSITVKFLAALCAAGPGTCLAAPLPWEVWHDLHGLARLPPGNQVSLRSSHCPSGCRFDRHSAGDQRFLYADGDEGVIFEEAGAGAITRIWMTMGFGTSQPLAASVLLRIYVDGAQEPAFEAPLPALFDGSTPPFVPPLVGDRLVSSGGNYSYVPIPYRNGCRITLVGAQEERIWFQFNVHRLAEPGDVVSFTGTEDLSAWAGLLAAAGQDPWQLTSAPPGRLTLGGASLEPGETSRLAGIAGPGLFAELSSVETLSRGYLEGDERLYLDRSPHPSVYGTGTEDLFNGGFYFDQGSFRLALHGSPYHFVEGGADVTAAYRLMVSDGVRFVDGVRAGLEGGPINDLSLRVRIVAYYYQRRTPGLWRWDVVDLGDASSRVAHGYTVSGPYEMRLLDGLFEGDPALALPGVLHRLVRR